MSESKKTRNSTYTTSDDLERNLLVLTGTKSQPGICRNRTHAIELSVRIVATRLRLGMDLRPVMGGETEKRADAQG